jgi:hypothetical protein
LGYTGPPCPHTGTRCQGFAIVETKKKEERMGKSGVGDLGYDSCRRGQQYERHASSVSVESSCDKDCYYISSVLAFDSRLTPSEPKHGKHDRKELFPTFLPAVARSNTESCREWMRGYVTFGCGFGTNHGLGNYPKELGTSNCLSREGRCRRTAEPRSWVKPKPREIEGRSLKNTSPRLSADCQVDLE